jgi:hypothetical protein
MKCNDCGNQLTDDDARDHSKRPDVCAACWKTRGELVDGKIVPLGGVEFKIIQRKMANGRGTAKRYIDSLR